MITKTTTVIHPTTGEIMQSIETILSVELDNNHVACRNNNGRYCVSCFTHGIQDVSTQSSTDWRGGEYIECYACKAIMKFKEGIT